MTIMKKYAYFSPISKISYILCINLIMHVQVLLSQAPTNPPAQSYLAPELAGLMIKKITVEGNKYIKDEAILKRLPFTVDQKFDESRSGMAIRNIYELGSFRQVRLEGEKLDDTSMNLFVVVEEKKLLEKLEFKGNRTLKTKQIKEKLNLDKLKTIDEEVMHRIAQSIKKLYREENKHLVNVTFELIPSQNNTDKASAIFTIHEGPTSRINRVYFVGNKNLPNRKLRNILFTRENWLLGFMDSAGTYQEDMLEMDKHRIEYFYRDHGYLTAKVAKAKVEFSKNNRDISVTFNIKEGALYTIQDISIIGDEVHNEEELLQLVVLEKGHSFSQSKLV